MNNSSSSTGESSSENCENCSSSFSLFKRKKICNLCKQAFCQSCVNRQTFSSVLNNRNSSQQNSNGSSERICVICQSICSPQTTVDDLMKLKLKHLRSILNNANVATSTCKEKRDLVDLVLRNRLKFQNLPQQQQARPSQPSSTPPPQQQQQTPPPPPPPQQTQQNSTFNDTFSSFMNNVQDFVNFNLNSALNQAQPAPAPPSTSSNSTNTNNNKKTFTQSTTNFNINGQPGSSTSSSSTSQMPSSSSSSSNLNSLFNLIGEQVPNVLQQTFTNNRFTFNNVFNGANEERRGSTSSNTSNRQATPPSPTPPSTQTPPQAAQYTPEPEPQPTEAAANNEPVIILKRRASLSDVKSENDIENLTIKQIKEILATNFVDYKGCCEKKELVEKAKRLFKSNENNKRLEKEITSNENSESNVASSSAATTTNVQENKKANVDESDLCKICMESLIDCVLLDCGHMVSCTKCGKRLAECPICRQNVIRVIRVFKS